jgi:hypothetical protein
MTNGFREAAFTAAGAWGPPGNRRGPRRRDPARKMLGEGYAV